MEGYGICPYCRRFLKLKNGFVPRHGDKGIRMNLDHLGIPINGVGGSVLKIKGYCCGSYEPPFCPKLNPSEFNKKYGSRK